MRKKNETGVQTSARKAFVKATVDERIWLKARSIAVEKRIVVNDMLEQSLRLWISDMEEAK